MQYLVSKNKNKICCATTPVQGMYSQSSFPVFKDIAARSTSEERKWKVLDCTKQKLLLLQAIASQKLELAFSIQQEISVVSSSYEPSD